MLRIYITAFNCAPNMGSEHSMGWNTIINLSQLTPITVVTRCEFEVKIREASKEYKNITFIFVKEPSIKKYYASINPMLEFYFVYPMWEYKVYKLLLSINQKEKIDIVHKLNIIGIKEPGFTWKLKGINFLIGPIGGFEYIGTKYFCFLGVKEKIYALLNNLLVFKVRYFSLRSKNAIQRAKKVYTINNRHKKFISTNFDQTNVSICSDSFPFKTNFKVKKRELTEQLQLVSSCRIEAVKGIQLLIQVLKALRIDIKYKFTLIGQGAYTPQIKLLLDKANINYQIIEWIDRKDLFGIFNNSHAFLYSSFKDASTHIIPEAISCGCPIICLDHLGYGEVVTSQVGFKVNTEDTIENIISNFKNIIEYIHIGNRFW